MSGKDWVVSSSSSSSCNEEHVAFLLQWEKNAVLFTNLDINTIQFYIVKVPFLVHFELDSGGLSASATGTWDPQTKKNWRDSIDLLMMQKRDLFKYSKHPFNTIQHQLQHSFAEEGVSYDLNEENEEEENEDRRGCVVS